MTTTPSTIVLRSAFKPPVESELSKWSRNPPMEIYGFIRTVASVDGNGSVILHRSEDDTEFIQLATDWPKGEEAFEKKEAYSETGFIGRGATKRGIYVCFIYNFQISFLSQIRSF